MPEQAVNGTADLNAFFDSIATFAVANAGMSTSTTTIEIPGNPPTQRNLRLINYGAVTLTIESNLTNPSNNLNFARMRMTYGAPTTEFTQDAPVGQPRFTCFGTWQQTGPFIGHRMFTDGTAVHAVLEVANNVFQHFSFGEITKNGTWIGGEYVCAGSQNSVSGSNYNYGAGSSAFVFDEGIGSGHNATASGVPIGTTGNCTGFVRYRQTGNNVDDFAPMNSTGLNNQAARLNFPINPSESSPTSLTSELVFSSPNQANSRTPLFPMTVLLRDYNITTNNLYFAAGYIPNVRVLSMRNFSPGVLTETNWRVYPVIQKAGDRTIAPVSNEPGYAYNIT